MTKPAHTNIAEEALIQDLSLKAINYEAIQVLKDKGKKKRFDETLEKQMRMLAKYAQLDKVFYGVDGRHPRYTTKTLRDKDVIELSTLFKHLTKEELINRLSLAALKIEFYEAGISLLTLQRSHLLTHFLADTLRPIVKSMDMAASKQAEFEANEEAMLKTIQKLEKMIQRPWIETDYQLFKNLLTTDFKVMPYKKRTRMTKEIKSLSLEKQEEEIKEIKTEGWLDSTMRNFFEKYTEVKPRANKRIRSSPK